MFASSSMKIQYLAFFSPYRIQKTVFINNLNYPVISIVYKNMCIMTRAQKIKI